MSYEKTSSNDHSHNLYLRFDFWFSESNQFWKSNTHSQESKDYFEDWIQKLVKDKSNKNKMDLL